MKKILWIVSLFSLPFLSEATSYPKYTSGYISLQYISGTSYQATVVLYSIGDPENSGACGNIGDGDTMRLYWGDGGSELLYRSNGKIYPPDTIPGGDSVCDCRKADIFIGNHTFPGPGSYRIWVDAVGRAAGIQNIVGSVTIDMLLFNTLSITSSSGYNFSPSVITNAPVCSYGCTAQCYNFNLGAYSPGGDSLSYALGNCLCLSGICPLYNNEGATVDPVTGKLSWCNPQSLGLYNFSILITTYQKVIISGKPIEIPVDTTEAELEMLVQSNCTLGIDEVTNAGAYTIYPNPTKGKFTIQSSVVSNQWSVEVYNVLGEKVYSQFNIQHPTFNIDLSGQPNGIYFYRVLNEDGGEAGSGKLVIEK